MDLVYSWYNYTCWFKILLSPIHIPAHDLQIKTTDLKKLLKFYLKVLKILYLLRYFSNHSIYIFGIQIAAMEDVLHPKLSPCSKLISD